MSTTSIEHEYDSKNSKMDVHIHNRSEGRTGHLALTLHLKRSRQAEKKLTRQNDGLAVRVQRCCSLFVSFSSVPEM